MSSLKGEGRTGQYECFQVTNELWNNVKYGLKLKITYRIEFNKKLVKMLDSKKLASKCLIHDFWGYGNVIVEEKHYNV